MGGKTWSREEEYTFWSVIVPQSPKAVDPADRVSNWEMCAQVMQATMGKQARRKYTKLMLFEHYFQNVATGHRSPHARKYVLEHRDQLDAWRQGEAGQAVADSPAGMSTGMDSSSTSDSGGSSHVVSFRGAVEPRYFSQGCTSSATAPTYNGIDAMERAPQAVMSTMMSDGHTVWKRI